MAMNSQTVVQEHTDRPSRYLLVVNDSVTGRMRIHVPDLYRNETLRRSLENKLSLLAELSTVRANVLTGNLLIEFRAGDGAESLPGHIVKALESVTGLPIIRHSEDIHRPQPLKPKKKAEFVKKKKLYPEIGYQEPPMNLWHTLTGAKVVRFVGSDEAGLSADVAARHLMKYGPNLLSEQRSRSSLQMFLQQFVSAPVAMLGLSAIISFATGGVADTVVIVTVVMINSVIGFITEKSAEKTINALGSLAPDTATVLRAGVRIEIPLTDVTVGDILILSPGSYIPADARLLASNRLSLDESPLTGESMPVGKNHEFIAAPETPMGDRENMVYMGTTVTGGNGRAVVVATGRHTEIGKIQSLVGETTSPQTPMQKQIDDMGVQLALLSSGICALVFIVGLLRGRPLPEMLMSAISLAVAAVPEGLPTVATTTLALGIKDMQRHKVLIRQLPAV